MNNSLPKISIIVPVYAVESYIEDCLRSVMAQDYAGEMECIVVNDSTPDRSIDKVSELLAAYNGPTVFVVVEHKHNRGLSAARNTGMQQATGDYLYFLDSDDELTPDCLSLLALPLQEQAYDMVIGNYRIVGSDKQYPPLSLPDGAITDRDVIKEMRRCYRWYPMAVNKLYRRHFLIETGLTFREGLIHEDELWTAQMACLLHSMYAVASHETYLYKIRESSITESNRYAAKRDALCVILQEFNAFIRHHGLEQDRGALQLLLNLLANTLSTAMQQGKETFCLDYAHIRSAAQLSPAMRHCLKNCVLPGNLHRLQFRLPTALAKRHYLYNATHPYQFFSHPRLATIHYIVDHRRQTNRWHWQLLEKMGRAIDPLYRKLTGSHRCDWDY